MPSTKAITLRNDAHHETFARTQQLGASHTSTGLAAGQASGGGLGGGIHPEGPAKRSKTGSMLDLLREKVSSKGPGDFVSASGGIVFI